MRPSFSISIASRRVIWKWPWAGSRGRATRLLAKLLARRGEEFWPPVYEGQGIQIGAFVVKWNLPGQTNHDELLPSDSHVEGEIVRLDREVIARRMQQRNAKGTGSGRMQLTGKTALITGGTLGIGAAIVLDLARRGADVSIVARNLGAPADALAKQVQSLGRRALLLSGDMARPEDCAVVVEKTASHFGRLDVLVHNAGGPSPGKIEDVSPEQWRNTMDLHVNANYYLARAALPHLKKHGEGCIITVSSTAGIRGVPGAIAYATAKGALPQFTRSLARDLADHNIRVNCVAPGVIRTRFHDDMTAGAERAEPQAPHPPAPRRDARASGRGRRAARHERLHHRRNHRHRWRSDQPDCVNWLVVCCCGRIQM